MKAIDIIQDAVEAIGEYSPGEPVSDADAERMLTALNDMIDQWSNDDLACFAFLQQSTPLVANKGAYTIGPSVSADINSIRPLRLEDRPYILDTQGNVYPCDLLTLQDWNLISNKVVTSQIPYLVYYDPQDPIAIINVYPVPTYPLYVLHWVSFLQLAEFPNLVVELNFPKGYVAAFKTNLAVRACKYFGKAVPPDLRAEANQTLASVKRTNIVPQTVKFDRELLGRSGFGFNILSGTNNP